MMTKTLTFIFSFLFVCFFALSCSHTHDDFTIEEMDEQAHFGGLLLDDPKPDDEPQ